MVNNIKVQSTFILNKKLAVSVFPCYNAHYNAHSQNHIYGGNENGDFYKRI